MVLPGGAATWTVLGPDHGVVGPAEEFLEYLRVQGTSPNTVKSYALGAQPAAAGPGGGSMRRPGSTCFSQTGGRSGLLAPF